MIAWRDGIGGGWRRLSAEPSSMVCREGVRRKRRCAPSWTARRRFASGA